MKLNRLRLHWAPRCAYLVHTWEDRRFSVQVCREGHFALVVDLDGPRWYRVDPATGEVLARIHSFMGIAQEESVEREGFYPKAPEAAE